MRCDEGIDWIYREVPPRLGNNHEETRNKELLLIVNALEVGSGNHSSILTWKIPWTEEPSGLHRSIESEIV